MNKLKKVLSAAVTTAVFGAAVTAYAQTTIPKPTPPAQPPIPAGLELAGRAIDRQDIPEYYALNDTPQPYPFLIPYPGESERNAGNISARVQSGHHGKTTASHAPLWLDSDLAGSVVVALGDGYLPLDKITITAAVLTVRVRDGQGNAVTVSQRAYRPDAYQVESVEASVRVDDRGRLLALPVVRVSQDASGAVTVTRDGGFAEDLTVSYRLLAPTTKGFAAKQTVTIPAGSASASVPVQAVAGGRLVVYAGSGYTPAPAEESDVIQF